jgi:hypothetical protein
LRRTARLFA